MREQKNLKMKKICFSMVLVMILASPVLVFAESYHGFSLTCTCEVTSTKATASTSGSGNPYYNYVSVIAYKGTASKGSDVARVMDSKASAKVSHVTGGLTKATSNHYVCDRNYSPVGTARETIVKHAYR